MYTLFVLESLFATVAILSTVALTVNYVRSGKGESLNWRGEEIGPGDPRFAGRRRHLLRATRGSYFVAVVFSAIAIFLKHIF